MCRHVDHLSIPTLVEVKRSSDTRIRREVVGQMLDYASHAVMYWSIDKLRTAFEQTCEDQGLEPNLELTALMDGEADLEAFWEQVKTNLQAGKIRMVFVADSIPAELQRVVEFLNIQMDPAEVVAVEIRQYVGQGLKTLVPRVIGQTVEAQQKKVRGTREGRQWDDLSFFAELETRHGTDDAEVARKILAWAQHSNLLVWWGRGARSGSFVPTLNHQGRDHQLFAVWTYGSVEIYFYWYQYKPPFDDQEKRQALLTRLNAIPGVLLPPDAITKRPGIPLPAFRDETALKQFLDTYKWVVQEIRAS